MTMAPLSPQKTAIAAVAFASAAAVLLYTVRSRRRKRCGPPRIRSCPALKTAQLLRKRRALSEERPGLLRRRSAPAPAPHLVHFYLVRHGASTWNKAGRIQGQLDLPLAPAGVLEAERLALALRDRRIDAVVSSPLTRALDTARVVCKRHGEGDELSVAEDARLKERHFGDLQGAYKADPGYRDFRQKQDGTLRAGSANFHAPGADGESFREVRSRAMGALEEVAKRSEAEHVLVVTHSHVIQALTWEASGVAWREMEQYMPVKNCSISEVIYNRATGAWNAGFLFEEMIAEPMTV